MSAKGLKIQNYQNGINYSRLIVDPALNILYLDSQPSTGTVLDIWLKGKNEPYSVQFPSPGDLDIAQGIIAMAISGNYVSTTGAGGASYTPAEDAQGIITISNQTRTGITPTTTTTTNAVTTTTTSGLTTTTTTGATTTTTTTLFPATLAYSYTKASGLTASFRVYKNGSLVATRSSSGSGIISVTAGDSVYATITSTNSSDNVIELSGGASGATLINQVANVGTITLSTFTVANGNSYHIDGTSDPV
jgi:hypothetical protein